MSSLTLEQANARLSSVESKADLINIFADSLHVKLSEYLNDSSNQVYMYSKNTMKEVA